MDRDDNLFDDDITFEDVMESRGETICDNCLTSPGHCPGQMSCDKWLKRAAGGSKPIDESQFEPRTIGFHLLDPDDN
jgi:hypothetical protein